MLILVASLLLVQAQPAPIDWEFKPTPQAAAPAAPAKPAPTFDEALAASYEADAKAAPKGSLGFGTPASFPAKDTEKDWGIDAYTASQAPPTIKTEAEAREAANKAAIERAEQAGKEANAPPGAWPDEGKMRCKTTDNGFVCGNSDKALEPDSPSRKALDEIMKPN